MKFLMRKYLLTKLLLLVACLFGIYSLANQVVAYAEFVEDFGHVGTLRTFKGQVRDSIDTPIPHAILNITSLGDDKNFVIEADDGGNFIMAELRSGKYKISVQGASTNIGEFTVRISQGSPLTSSKYIIIKLSPGCASGDSGVKLVSKIKK